MKVHHNERGFQYLEDGYMSVQQSSAIGDYEDSFEKPGSSALWIDDESYNREEVQELLDSREISSEFIPHLRAWLKTGSLEISL